MPTFCKYSLFINATTLLATETKLYYWVGGKNWYKEEIRGKRFHLIVGVKFRVVMFKATPPSRLIAAN
jgi:hypothetical protein